MDLPERVEAAVTKAKAERTPADLRLLLAQRSDLQNAVPHAIEILDENPLIEAQSYPGDLLKAMLALPVDYWAEDQSSWLMTHSVLKKLDRTLAEIAEARAQFMKVAS